MSDDLVEAADRVPVVPAGWLVAVMAPAALLAARWQVARRLVVRRLVRPVRKVWPATASCAVGPPRVFTLIISHVLVTAGLGATLCCCLRAFDVHLSVTTLLLALLVGSAAGSAALFQAASDGRGGPCCRPAGCGDARGC